MNELRKLLLQNGYPAGVVNYNINDVLNMQTCALLSCLSLQFVYYFLLSYDGQRERIFKGKLVLIGSEKFGQMHTIDQYLPIS